MCNVKELIEELQTLPENTVVNVLNVNNGYSGIWVNWSPLNIDRFSDNFDFIDLNGNPFCTEEEQKSNPSLDLGCS